MSQGQYQQSAYEVVCRRLRDSEAPREQESKVIIKLAEENLSYREKLREAEDTIRMAGLSNCKLTIELHSAEQGLKKAEASNANIVGHLGHEAITREKLEDANEKLDRSLRATKNTVTNLRSEMSRVRVENQTYIKELKAVEGERDAALGRIERAIADMNKGWGY